MDLAVVSTYASDTIIEEGKPNRSVVGGPGKFIREALDEYVPMVRSGMMVGEIMNVEIRVTPSDEVGLIIPPRVTLSIPKIAVPNMLVSTLLNEWSLDGIAAYEGKLFVDAQGFVREVGGGFGQKRVWSEVALIGKKLFCLKATELEASFIPAEFLREQARDRCLIVTKGKEGLEVHYRGQRREFKPQIVVSPPNTVGAGDTFLANFVAKYVLTGDVWEAVASAMVSTSSFLLGKC